MSLTITDGTTTVTLTQPMTVMQGKSKRIQRHVFRDGTYAVHDIGKARETLTLTGSEYETETEAVFPLTFPVSFAIQGKMYDLDSLADGGEEVTVAGMSDSNLDGDYFISSFRYRRREGRIDRYDYSLILEKS